MDQFFRKLKIIFSRIYTFQRIGIYFYDTAKYAPKTVIDISQVTQNNLTDILDFQNPRYVNVFHEFLRLGDHGYYAYFDNKCIHRSWVKSNEQVVYPHWAYPVKLNPKQFFIHYCETSPQARGKGVYPAVLSKIVNDFKEKGEILMSIDINNIASIKGAQKAGFRERESSCVGSIGYEVCKKTGLRVLIITQGVSRIVEPLISSHHKVVGILESASRNYKKRKTVYKIVSFVNELYSLITGMQPTLKAFAKKHTIPYQFMTSSNDPNLAEWVKSLNSDIIVVFSMSQLLKDNIFSIPKYGAINLHPAMLPEYRGANPDFWQYYNMEMNPGVTVHYIDKGEDTGDIIYQERTTIPLGTKSPPRLDILIGQVGVKLILKALDAIQAGNAPRIKQPIDSPTDRARNLFPEEHKTVIDWQNWDIERIWHILRGTELWLDAIPQQTGLWKGQRWNIEGFEKVTFINGIVGTIGKHNGNYCVITKEGYIYLSRKFSLKKLIIGILLK